MKSSFYLSLVNSKFALIILRIWMIAIVFYTYPENVFRGMGSKLENSSDAYKTAESSSYVIISVEHHDH